MGIQKRHHEQAAELLPLWFYSFAAEATAVVAGDGLEVPEHHGCGKGTHGGPCPLHR